jgi:hypothetical protein
MHIKLLPRSQSKRVHFPDNVFFSPLCVFVRKEVWVVKWLESVARNKKKDVWRLRMWWSLQFAKMLQTHD